MLVKGFSFHGWSHLLPSPLVSSFFANSQNMMRTAVASLGSSKHATPTSLPRVSDVAADTHRIDTRPARDIAPSLRSKKPSPAPAGVSGPDVRPSILSAATQCPASARGPGS